MTDILTTTPGLDDQDDDRLAAPEDREEPQMSGADLARMVLNAARRTARTAGHAPAKPKKPTLRDIARQGLDAREPAGLAAVVPAMTDAHGWALGTARGSIRDRWQSIVGTENSQHWAPAGFDPDTRTLRVLADTPAWATKLRLTTRQVLADLDKHLPPGSVKAIDIRIGHHQVGPDDDDDRRRTPTPTAPDDDRPHPLASSTTYQQLRQQMREQVLAREAAQEEERARKEEILRQHYGWLREPEDAHRPASDGLAAEHAAAHARRLRASHNAALATARAARAGAIPLPRPATAASTTSRSSAA
ncbi:DciA family protein [Kitasatospora sp. NPDC057223]|uniref:DciA family protein n=1 Tax=Kitasatospora sp. NPDC057223 TaxID=3346055 RepID=UPI0036291076